MAAQMNGKARISPTLASLLAATASGSARFARSWWICAITPKAWCTTCRSGWSSTATCFPAATA